MLTRFKKKSLINNNIPEIPPDQDQNNPPIQDDDEDDIDEYGNIKWLIDYSYDNIKSKKNKIIKKSKKNSNKKMDDLLTIMLANIMNSNVSKNLTIHIPGTPKDDENINNGEIVDDDDEENNEENNNGEDEENDDEEEDKLSIYDELDENFMEIEEGLEYDEDENVDYFHKLEKEKKESILCEMKKINEINGLNVPLKFKILNSNMDINTKAIAMRNIEKLNEMDVSTGEYSKWINGLMD